MFSCISNFDVLFVTSFCFDSNIFGCQLIDFANLLVSYIYNVFI